MTLVVHFPTLPASDTLDELRPLLSDRVQVSTGPVNDQPVETDILVGGAVTEEQLMRSPRLSAVIVPFAGIPFPTQELLRRHPQIALHNLHFNDQSTGEMALALMMAAAKHVPQLDRRLRTGDWRWDDAANPTDTFLDKTALILGYGAIGRRVAPVCRALGMDVIGVRRHEPDAPQEDAVAVYSTAHLHKLLPRADVLICLLPHTPETEGLLGAEELALLPDHCILVNVGRGPVIDEEALYTALAERRIRAAGLDVWWQYPKGDEERGHTYPSRLPFHELDSVVMTPHRGGWLQSFEKLRVRALAELLNAAAEGREMPNRVNTELGY